MDKVKQETEKNCIGCMFYAYLMQKDRRNYCYNKESKSYGYVKGKGPSCELKQIRK